MWAEAARIPSSVKEWERVDDNNEESGVSGYPDDLSMRDWGIVGARSGVGGTDTTKWGEHSYCLMNRKGRGMEEGDEASNKKMWEKWSSLQRDSFQ